MEPQAAFNGQDKEHENEKYVDISALYDSIFEAFSAVQILSKINFNFALLNFGRKNLDYLTCR